MPKVDEIEEENARYVVTSDGTAPSFRTDFIHAAANMALRVGLGYKNTRLVVLDETNAGQFQPLEGVAH